MALCSPDDYLKRKGVLPETLKPQMQWRSFPTPDPVTGPCITIDEQSDNTGSDSGTSAGITGDDIARSLNESSDTAAGGAC